MGALSTYQTLTRSLVDDPAGSASLYSDTEVLTAINLARVQLAGDAECLRQPATIPTVVGQRAYAFTSAVFIAAPTVPPGLAGILSVRSIGRQLASGIVKVYGLTWERFNTFHVMTAVSIPGIPTRWATLQPGISGTFWVDPIPDGVYTLQLDPVCYPEALVDDNTPEALPYPWTDSVPYWAAYQLYLWKQREADATAMFQLYRLFALRGTQLTTPSQLADNFAGGAQAIQAMHRSLIGGPPEQTPR